MGSGGHSQTSSAPKWPSQKIQPLTTLALSFQRTARLSFGFLASLLLRSASYFFVKQGLQVLEFDPANRRAFVQH